MGNKIVYGWFHRNIIFYVGIGSISRSKTNKGRNKYCSRKRAKAEKEGTFEIKILHSGLTWEEACEIECHLIQQYGRIDLGTGILTNMTDGGDGKNGYRYSSSTIDKLRKAQTGKIHSNDTKNKISESLKGIERSQSSISKMSMANQGNKNACTSIQTPAGKFNSIGEASKFYLVSTKTIRCWLNNEQKSKFYRI